MSWASYAWGASAWGSGAPAGSTVYDPSYSHGRDVRVYIGGRSFTGALSTDPLEIVDELNQRSSCTFSPLDKDGSFDRTGIAVGAIVRITLDGSVVFGGTVDRLTEQIPDDVAPVTAWAVECVDFAQLFDRHLVAFKSSGESLYSLIYKIVTLYSGDGNETLAAEGITTDGVQGEDYQIGPVTFPYVTAAKALDDLAELTGMSWYVDAQKDLHFFDRLSYPCPFELDPDKWSGYKDLRVERGREEYRNLQVLRAGDSLTNTRTETFVGDGETTSWDLAVPCGEAPTIAINGVEVDDFEVIERPKSGEPSGGWFYWGVGDERIDQDTDQAVLEASDTLTITYRGLYPVVVQARDDGEIQSRKAVETGTGIYAQVEEDESVDDEQMAREKVAGILKRYGKLRAKVTFGTFEAGFRSGQLMRVRLPQHGIDDMFLITAVRATYREDTLWEYRVEAAQGEYPGSWVDFYKRLANKGRKLSIREDEVLYALKAPKDGVLLGDRVSTETALADYLSDYCYRMIWGLSRIGGRRDATPGDPDQTGDGVRYGPLIGAPYR